MQAVCYKCGEEKKFPLTLCNHCQAVPHDLDDRVASMALSAECLKEKNLIKASNYIKIKKKLPRFHDVVMDKAKALVAKTIDQSTQSFELSASFFDFNPEQGKKDKQMVTVHSIGKPPGVGDEHCGPVSRDKTYQMLSWEIGKDISAEEVQMHMDAFGCIYVWFRWIDKGWSWKCVTKSEFQNLRKVER